MRRIRLYRMFADYARGTTKTILPDPIPECPLPAGNDPTTIRVWANGVMEAFGLIGRAGWTFGFDNAKRRLGCCHYRKRMVTMSRHYLSKNTPEQFRNTLLHEIAHALAGPGAGHGPEWVAVARRIGCNGRRCGEADMPEGAWRAVCGGCSRAYSRHRRPKTMTGWYCKKCGGTEGALTWARAGTVPAT